jgi:hypothetical protein
MKIQTKMVLWWALICVVVIGGAVWVTIAWGQGILDRAGEPPPKIVCCEGCRESLHSLALHQLSLQQQVKQLQQKIEDHKHPHTHAECNTCTKFSDWAP